MRQLFRTWWLVALSAGPMPLPPRGAVERVSSTNPILGLDIVAWNSATTIWISRNWSEAELVDAESIDLWSLRTVRPTEFE